jgi:hypothetical protein
MIDNTITKRKRTKGQWSTKHYIENKYWAKRTQLKPGVDPGAPEG